MASADLRKELECSVCLNIYTDPVTLKCGHNFCRDSAKPGRIFLLLSGTAAATEKEANTASVPCAAVSEVKAWGSVTAGQVAEELLLSVLSIVQLTIWLPLSSPLCLQGLLTDTSVCADTLPIPGGSTSPPLASTCGRPWSGGYSCPECREEFQDRPALHRNITLRNIVENFLSTHPDQEESGVFCTYCIHTPVPAVISCLHCEASLCDNHLRVHSKSPEHVLCDPTTSLENRKCSVHKKILEYYCTEDETCICMSCRLDAEHRGHQVETLDEASEMKKKKLRNVLQKLMTEREEMEKRVQSLQEHGRKVQGEADDETERVTVLFRDLRRRLEDLEKRVLREISGQAERISGIINDLVQDLEIKKEELSRKLRHIEELCNVTDPLTVLQESDTGDLCDTEDGDDEDRERHDNLLHDGGDLDVGGISHTLHTGLSDIIPRDSCHHPNWLKSIPKGQFQRVRRNCSGEEDFEVQANILKKITLLIREMFINQVRTHITFRDIITGTPPLEDIPKPPPLTSGTKVIFFTGGKDTDHRGIPHLDREAAGDLSGTQQEVNTRDHQEETVDGIPGGQAQGIREKNIWNNKITERTKGGNKDLDKFETFIDLQKFVRKLNIKKFFANTKNTGKEKEELSFRHSQLRNNSIFNPNQQQNEEIKVFRKMVERDIRELTIKPSKKKGIWKTIKQLEKKKDIVIRPADKEGGLVILNKADYEQEMANLLNIPDTYKQLKQNPKEEYNKKLNNYVQKGLNKGILNKKEARYLIPNAPKTPVIYYVPKIHKSQAQPPGRPIVSGIDSLFSRLGAYVDGFLQPLVVKGKSYLRDSRQLLKELENVKVGEKDLLVTIDVNSLYTNIKQKDGLNAVEWALHKKSDLKQEQIDYILEGLDLAMRHNHFCYKGTFTIALSLSLLLSAMASADLRKELECSVCLNVYTDPVILKCGHNFCWDCIGRVWDTQEGSGDYSCPECREEFQDRPALHRNITLRNIVENFLSTHPDQEESGVFCTYCIHTPVPAVISCLLCEASLCDNHLRVHSKSPEHVLCDPTTSLENRKCSVHKKILEYYCTEDETCICMSCCLIGDHINHKKESLDEASEMKKKKLRNVLQKLMTEREEMEKRVQSLQEHGRKVQGEADDETQRVTVLFKDLRRRLEDLEKRVLREISGQAERISGIINDLVQDLEIKKEELSRKLRHIEELCNVTDPLTVLQESDTGDLCDTEDGDDEDRERHDNLLYDGGDLDVGGISHTLHTGLSDIMSGVNVEKCPGTHVYPHSTTKGEGHINAEPSRGPPQLSPTIQPSRGPPQPSPTIQPSRGPPQPSSTIQPSRGPPQPSPTIQPSRGPPQPSPTIQPSRGPPQPSPTIQPSRGPPQPSSTIQPSRGPPQLSPTIQPSRGPPQPSPTIQPSRGPPQPSSTIQPSRGPPQPSPTIQPSSGPPQPSPTIQPSRGPPQPSPTIQPSRGPPQPSPTIQPSGGPPQPSPTIQPSRGPPQPSPTIQPSRGPPQPSPTIQPSRGPPQPSPTIQHSHLQAGGPNMGAVQQTSGVSGVTDILLDVRTAGNNLHISDDRKTASSSSHQNRPETPERFEYHQVLSSQRFSSGRHYWEVDVGGAVYWRVGMCYPSIDRRGDQSLIGCNKKSWCLERGLYDNHLSVRHDSNKTPLPGDVSSRRVRIDLDYEAGRISFYDLCDPIRHLHTFTTTFTEPLHAGVYVGGGVWRGRIKICGGDQE
ncbi:uncharacterized protein LOC143975965 [Lithobates pipiens]